jgi:hypothetical protein
MGCAQAKSGKLEEQVFELGRDDQVRVRIPAVNRGLGTTPNQLNISFNTEELKQFLNVTELPLPAQALALLDRKECHGDMGGAHFSVLVGGALDHTVKTINERRKYDANYMYQGRPKAMHGLLNYGPIAYNKNDFGLTDFLFLPEMDRPFGFRMQCGLLNSPLEGGCTVSRDTNKHVDIKYHYCESMLPYWREMDNLYFEIIRRAVEHPLITPEYRIGGNEDVVHTC